jgi:hypothetical protein
MAKDFAIQLIDNNDNGTIGDLKVSPVLDGDGKILSGLVVGPTLEQNMAMILMSSAGENKQYPTLGVGMSEAILDEDLLEMRHKIDREFAKDGLKVTELELYDLKNIKIKANY